LPGNADVNKSGRVKSPTGKSADDRKVKSMATTAPENNKTGAERPADKKEHGNPISESLTLKNRKKTNAKAESAASRTVMRKSAIVTRGVVREMHKYIGDLYSANFAKSGFGGGLRGVIDDIDLYIAAKTIHTARLNGKVKETSEILNMVFGNKIVAAVEEKDDKKIPLAAKITVALDIHSGSFYTRVLCDYIIRISDELSSGLFGDGLQTKELIDGLIAFAVGQGIKII